MKSLHRITPAVVSLFLISGLAACANRDVGTDSFNESSDANDISIFNVSVQEAYDDVVEELRDQNVTVMDAGTFDQSMFPLAHARQISVNGEMVRLFIYETQDAAEAAAETINPNTLTVNNQQLSWQGTHHFFYEDQVIAIYSGSNMDVLEALQTVMGDQIAGAEWDGDMLDDADNGIINEPLNNNVRGNMSN